MKKIISFLVLFLFSFSIIWETFARSSSSSSSRSSSSFSRSSSSSSSYRSSSSSSSSSRSSSISSSRWSSSYKSSTQKRLNTDSYGDVTWYKTLTTKDIKSSFSTTDFLLLYLLVNWWNKTTSFNADNLSEDEKQKLIDYYNENTDTLESKFDSCGDTMWTYLEEKSEKIKLPNIKWWDFSKRQSLLENKSELVKLSKLTPIGLRYKDEEKETERVITPEDSNCLSKVSVQTTYSYNYTDEDDNLNSTRYIYFSEYKESLKINWVEYSEVTMKFAEYPDTIFTFVKDETSPSTNYKEVEKTLDNGQKEIAISWNWSIDSFRIVIDNQKIYSDKDYKLVLLDDSDVSIYDSNLWRMINITCINSDSSVLEQTTKFNEENGEFIDSKLLLINKTCNSSKDIKSFKKSDLPQSLVVNEFFDVVINWSTVDSDLIENNKYVLISNDWIKTLLDFSKSKEVSIFTWRFWQYIFWL